MKLLDRTTPPVSQALQDDRAALERALKLEAAEAAEALRKGGPGSGPRPGSGPHGPYPTHEQASKASQKANASGKAGDHADARDAQLKSASAHIRAGNVEAADKALKSSARHNDTFSRIVAGVRGSKSDSPTDLTKGGGGSGRRTGEEMGGRSEQAQKDTKLALAASAAANEATSNHEKAADGQLQGHAAMMHSHAADAHDSACSSNGTCGAAGKQTAAYHKTAAELHRDMAGELGAK